MSESAAIQRRRWDILLPVMIALVIGMVSGFAAFAGRVSTVETNLSNDRARIDRLEPKMDAIVSGLAKIDAEVTDLSARLPVRSKP